MRGKGRGQKSRRRGRDDGHRAWDGNQDRVDEGVRMEEGGEGGNGRQGVRDRANETGERRMASRI